MVSSLFVDALRDPTQSLLDLYDPSKPIDGFPSVVSRHFSDIFNTKDAFQEISVLSVHNPPESHPNRALVRFRAMVQDTSLSPEMYLAKLKDDKCGGWGITDTTADGNHEDINYTDLRECTVVWAVNVPGETTWCSDELDGFPSVGSTKKHQPSQPHKFPVPGANHIGVQIKLYDLEGSEPLRATDILTFVGILTFEPLRTELDAPIEVPTLHVLFSRPHTTLVQRPYPVENIAPMREELITWLAKEALGGDKEAAEWVILMVISRVQSRTPPILPPSLTLSRFPSPESPSATPTLSHVLEELLPISLTLPLSLDLLNNENFTPESKQEDFHSGFLQLPPGANFLITESAIQEGKLIEKGIMNLRSIQDVLASQTLAYVFPFSQFSFLTDVTGVVLSEGEKSVFFQTSVILPVTVKGSAELYKPKGQVNLPSSEKLAAFRNLLLGSMSGNVQVDEAASKYIQDDFVSDRKQDKSITADGLILRMSVARLLALSLHEREVTVAVWEKTKELDARRKARLA